MKTAKELEIHDIILRLLPKWEAKGYTPYSINSGCCEDFAMELIEAIETSPTLKHGDYCMMWGEEYPELFENVCPRGHCFVRYNDMYYDSESTFGVINPEKLLLYIRNGSHSCNTKCEGCKGCKGC